MFQDRLRQAGGGAAGVITSERMRMPSTPPSGGSSPVSRFDGGHMFHPPPLQHAPMRPGMIPFRMPPGTAIPPGMQMAVDPRQMHPQYALQRMAAQDFMAPPSSSGTTVGSPMGMAPTAPNTVQSVVMAASSQLPGMTPHPAPESRPRPGQHGALHQPAKSDVEKGDDHLDELLGK